jgi:hypothetical protein
LKKLMNNLHNIISILLVYFSIATLTATLCGIIKVIVVADRRRKRARRKAAEEEAAAANAAPTEGATITESAAQTTTAAVTETVKQAEPAATTQPAASAIPTRGTVNATSGLAPNKIAALKGWIKLTDAQKAQIKDVILDENGVVTNVIYTDDAATQCKCNDCGMPSPQDFASCPICGADFE